MMKTEVKVLKEYPGYKTLINAVVSRIGKESIRDVNNHGIDGGFGGFVYYSDTISFWKRHKKTIMKMAEDMADDMGQNIMEMIGGFNCLKYFDYQSERWTDKEGQRAIGETIYGSKTDTQVGNAMAWFAAEEVCRMFED